MHRISRIIVYKLIKSWGSNMVRFYHQAVLTSMYQHSIWYFLTEKTLCHIFRELQSLTITYSECDLRSLTITWSEPFENMIYNHSQSWLAIISDCSKKIAPIFLRRIWKGLAPFFTILLWRILKGLAPIFYHFVVENF